MEKINYNEPLYTKIRRDLKDLKKRNRDFGRTNRKLNTRVQSLAKENADLKKGIAEP